MAHAWALSIVPVWHNVKMCHTGTHPVQYQYSTSCVLLWHILTLCHTVKSACIAAALFQLLHPAVAEQDPMQDTPQNLTAVTFAM